MILNNNIFNSLFSRSSISKLLILALCSFAASADYGLATDDQDYNDDTLPFVEIKYATDFSQLAEVARAESKIIMLEVSASDCEFCDLLEEEFIKPMLRSGDYTDVLIRKIDMDSISTIKDLSGAKTTAEELSRDLKVQLTPTLLFFDGHGNEVSARILGINSLDLYGGYLDDALKDGLKKIKSQ